MPTAPVQTGTQLCPPKPHAHLRDAAPTPPRQFARWRLLDVCQSQSSRIAPGPGHRQRHRSRRPSGWRQVDHHYHRCRGCPLQHRDRDWVCDHYASRPTRSIRARLPNMQEVPMNRSHLRRGSFARRGWRCAGETRSDRHLVVLQVDRRGLRTPSRPAGSPVHASDRREQSTYLRGTNPSEPRPVGRAPQAHAGLRP
ncbi:unannotated protein [freshwater metagenome]|uniref:Unannotated protein n=1 Tax=freshwater metagenome TaxID=449393 RepID=A0A6J7GJS2_9ZZZZ